MGLSVLRVPPRFPSARTFLAQTLFIRSFAGCRGLENSRERGVNRSDFNAYLGSLLGNSKDLDLQQYLEILHPQLQDLDS